MDPRINRIPNVENGMYAPAESAANQPPGQINGQTCVPSFSPSTIVNIGLEALALQDTATILETRCVEWIRPSLTTCPRDEQNYPNHQSSEASNSLLSCQAENTPDSEQQALETNDSGQEVIANPKHNDHQILNSHIDLDLGQPDVGLAAPEAEGEKNAIHKAISDSDVEVPWMEARNILKAENKRLKDILLCIKCYERDANILFLPCSHHKYCDVCSPDVTHCPACNKEITQKVTTYLE